MGNTVLALTYPAGKRLTVVIAATAGNVITNKSPPDGKRWLILRGRIVLVPDANPANRQLLISLTDGTNIEETVYASQTITASQTRATNIGEARVVDTGTLGEGQGYLGIDPILLEGDDQIRLTISAGLAGDSYSGFLVVLEL